MIASVPLPAGESSLRQSDEEISSWQSAFQSILPAVRSQAHYAFRHLSADAREEAIQETTCFACSAFAKLFRRGRAESVTPSNLARFAILRCRGGREFGQRRNGHDALSTFARRRQTIRVESLQAEESSAGGWWEVLVEDSTVTPADLAASRIDYPAFLATIDPRRRQIAETLATGETTLSTAKRFGLSPTRICQFRQQLRAAWKQFVGNVGSEAA